jgi:N-glycosylase/DNA lyase
MDSMQASKSILEPLTLAQLRVEYQQRQTAIQARLAEFRTLGATASDVELFAELVFCIFTAGASARMGIKSLARVRPILLTGDQTALENILVGAHRYPRGRAGYIVHTRDYLQQHCGLQMRKLLASFPDRQSRRDFWAANRDIKGIGLKEASHFLRNIGYPGYAILDKHVLRSLHELGLLEDPHPPKNSKQYFAIEQVVYRLAEQLEIDCDELDLLLWSHKTGEILK